jgi:hypothetical protein
MNFTSRTQALGWTAHVYMLGRGASGGLAGA